VLELFLWLFYSPKIYVNVKPCISQGFDLNVATHASEIEEHFFMSMPKMQYQGKNNVKSFNGKILLKLNNLQKTEQSR